ncbi:MAG: Hsp20/alpha crystallin family protein [Bdellovibrionales bacterium]|nr:Hsp20/alpha crystallin family protein [Bdellovibrionales bacterium]
MINLIPYWSPRNVNVDIFREMDRMLDDVAAPKMTTYREREFTPATEIIEVENHYLLSVDLPGLKKEDIHIEMVENKLSISGERKRERHRETHRIQRTENSFATFKSSFVLPDSVAADKIEANYADGVLELYLPKTQLAQSRKIEIQSGKSGFFDKLLGANKSEKETARQM